MDFEFVVVVFYDGFFFGLDVEYFGRCWVTVHGFCGAWGTLAAGLFFENNMFNTGIIAVQGLGILTAFAWGFGVALIVFKVLDLVLGGLRVSKQHEQRGLDYTEHAELSYPEFQRDVTFETDDMTKRH